MKEQYMRIKQGKIQRCALAASVHTKKPRMVCLRGCAAGVGAAVSVMEQADVGISAKYYTLIYYFLKKG
jgi:hypothetical protein